MSASSLRAGTYKIPTANDIPLDLRVTLLRDAPCKRTPQAHSSKAVGEPPFFLGASVFFALKVFFLYLFASNILCLPIICCLLLREDVKV